MAGEPDVAVAGAVRPAWCLPTCCTVSGSRSLCFERKPRADLRRLPKAALIEYRTVRLLMRALPRPILNSLSRITAASSAPG